MEGDDNNLSKDANPTDEVQTSETATEVAAPRPWRHETGHEEYFARREEEKNILSGRVAFYHGGRR